MKYRFWKLVDNNKHTIQERKNNKKMPVLSPLLLSISKNKGCGSGFNDFVDTDSESGSRAF
jgi:hypothetical protein